MLYQFHRDIFFFFLFVFFFLHHLDLSVLPGQLLCIVYSRNRVSLEPSKFSMMAEIVCTVYVEESRSGEGNLELCLDDIIEGRWNDGVVCLRSLKGSIEIFFVVLVLFESLVFGGLYVINLMDNFARDIYLVLVSFYLYENNLDVVIVGKKMKRLSMCLIY